MSQDLPREILPLAGLPKSRIGKDFWPPSRSIMGHPAGLPHFFGRVVLTDGFEYLVHTQDGRFVICHVQWFEEHKTSGQAGTAVAKSPRRETAPRKEKALVLIEDLL